MATGGLAKVSPATRIPALEIGDLVMSESGAITEYLVETYAPRLGVAIGQAGRTDYLQWIHYSETMASLIEQLNLQMVFLRPPAKASPIVIKLNVARSPEEAELQASGKSIQELAAEEEAEAEFEIAELFDDIGSAASDDDDLAETVQPAEEAEDDAAKA